ncbi:MAG: methylamine methyltransferase corrinoid protein reductive activase [Methanohalobium sp.]|uniref:methylamine methyltransferase corrinoid protein reductive activase n=1 Tax=Methanohalobium sp. TaxID=2837493 RepID=UPI00397C4378
MKTGVAFDLGTSGFRAHKMDLETGEIKRTVITLRNPIPGANVMDHMDFAIHYGQDLTHDLVIDAVKNIISKLEVETGNLERISVCGNPIQLSLFQGMTIEDLAYAGERKKQKYNIKDQERTANILDSSEITGLEEFNDCNVVIPPAIRHEVGADALALMVVSGMLDSDEIAIATDYGTNAEMALKVDDVIYTGSAAAGPALEGQQIKHGVIASPYTISNIEFENGYMRNYVLNEEMTPVKGDLVDPKTGEVKEKGDIRAKGVTGTGVIALIDKCMENGLIKLPNIQTPDKVLKLQDNVQFGNKDLSEAGKALGALRAGHITLCNTAGIEMEDVTRAYMSGASGTYVDALKAYRLGMSPYNVDNISQIGNTSLVVARQILLSEDRLWELQDIANKIVGHHTMFATEPAFRDTYVLEIAYWDEGMPFKMLKKYLKKKSLPQIDEPNKTPGVEKRVVKDIPVLGEEGLHVLENVGTYLTTVLDDPSACEKSVEVCPTGAINIDDDGKVMIRTDLCEGIHCQKCVRACSTGELNWENLEVIN